MIFPWYSYCQRLLLPSRNEVHGGKTTTVNESNLVEVKNYITLYDHVNVGKEKLCIVECKNDYKRNLVCGHAKMSSGFHLIKFNAVVSCII